MRWTSDPWVQVGVLHLYVEDLRGIDVDASKAEARADSFIEATMQSCERDLPSRVDRPVNERDQVEVADARRVIARRQRPSDKQIAGPAERREPAPELLHDERRGSHERHSRSSFAPELNAKSLHGDTERWRHTHMPRGGRVPGRHRQGGMTGHGRRVLREPGNRLDSADASVVGHDGWMPLLVDPALPAGSLRTVEQPLLRVDEQLVLRPWRADDAATVRAAFACPDIQRWHVRRMDSDDEARAWTAGWATRWADETDASWAIVDERDDQPVGQVGLRSVSLVEASAQLSYWVLPTARGTGIAARALRTLTRWTFDVLGLNRLFLLHSTANLASCRVAGKAGFGVEGTLRDSMLHADGWHDVHLHARLRTDVA